MDYKMTGKKRKKREMGFLSWDINSYTDCLKIIQGVSVKVKPPAQGYV